MKEYTNPEFERVEQSPSDVITTSPGTETPRHEADEGIWNLDL